MEYKQRTRDYIKVMRGWLDDKVIQGRNKPGTPGDNKWRDIPKNNEPVWCWEKTEYRIKPPYRPFKNAQEFLLSLVRYGVLFTHDCNGRQVEAVINSIGPGTISIRDKDYLASDQLYHISTYTYEELLNNDNFWFEDSKGNIYECGVEEH